MDLLERLLGTAAWDQVVFWALDLETTGVDPSRDLILSVGMVPVREGLVRWGERFYSLVRPPAGHVPSVEAMAVHHILPGELRDAPGISEVLPEVASRLQEGPLLVHWAKLDVGVLRRVYREQGLEWPRPVVVDTVRLLARLGHRRRQIVPHADGLPTELGAARKELGLPPHRRHHALDDALATAELFLALRHRLGARRLRHLR